MKYLWRKPFVGLLIAFFVGTCSGYARFWDSHKSNTRSASITFANEVRFNNGTTLPAGTYKMEVPEGSQSPVVSFSKDGKVMATAKAKLISENKKNPYTEVDSSARGKVQQVNTIRPGGWEEVLRFNPAK
jgi:hypothetical protein